jgi:hypothetical protein
MKNMQFVVILVAFFAAHQAAAQNTTFLSAPAQLWTANVAPLGVGNECAFAPTTFNPLLICTSSEGTVTALDASSVTTPVTAWTYRSSGTSSSSGITFSSNGTFFIYSTTDTSGTVPYWCVRFWVCECSAFLKLSDLSHRFFPVTCMLCPPQKEMHHGSLNPLSELALVLPSYLATMSMRL